MGKKKATPSSVVAARRPHKVAKTLANKKRKLAKHVANNKNDKQAAAAVGKPRSERKKPFAKGSIATANRNKLYRNEAGHCLEAPSFQSTVRKVA